MKAEIKGNDLIITIPINKNPQPSASGKTLTVASTSGFKDAGTKFKDKSLMVSVNAYIKP